MVRSPPSPQASPAKEVSTAELPSQRVGPAPGVGATSLLPVTVPALRIHKSRTALSLEAQGSLVSASWGRAVLGLMGLEQAKGNQGWGPKCLRRKQGRGSQDKDRTSDSTSSFPNSMLTSQSGHKGLEPCGQV